MRGRVAMLEPDPRMAFSVGIAKIYERSIPLDALTSVPAANGREERVPRERNRRLRSLGLQISE
jgi:hypothetical protein